MSVYSIQYHAMVMSPSPAGVEAVTVAANKAAGANAPTASGPSESFFHHLLDVINPLQHLPVIGTIYRAITGEHIGTIEKIAGDALYGGLWGAVASIADVAFEAVTGKSVEDTAMAWIKDQGKPAVAANKVAAPDITANASLPGSDLPALPSLDVVAANSPYGLDIAALTSSLSAKGVNGDTASRALYAYRRSLGFPVTQPVLASVH
jgi:hypothetical protein